MYNNETYTLQLVQWDIDVWHLSFYGLGHSNEGLLDQSPNEYYYVNTNILLTSVQMASYLQDVSNVPESIYWPVRVLSAVWPLLLWAT